MSLNKKLYQLFETEKDDIDQESPIFNSIKENESRYSDKDLIAKGGMKHVYKVFDSITQRKIAYAELIDAGSKQKRESFLREARITASLKHPNIISLYDMGIDRNNLPYFTMELKEGINLQCLLDKYNHEDINDHKFANDRLQIFIKICDAVAYAHSKNVIHNDLKPANIQVGSFGEVIVCDWGISQIVDEVEGHGGGQRSVEVDSLKSVTLDGKVRGTLGYISPERLESPHVSNVQSDIYALGCLLYILVYNRQAFNAHEDELGRIQHFNYRHPDSVKINEGLKSIIDQCLKIEPSERYSSVQQIRKDVLLYLANYSTSGERASWFRKSQLWFKRNQKVTLTVISSFTLISIISLFYLIHLRKQDSDLKKMLMVMNQDRDWSNLVITDHYDLMVKDAKYFLWVESLKFENKDSLDLCIKFYSKLIEAFPEKKYLYAYRARAFFYQQNFQSAFESYKEADISKPIDENLFLLSKKYKSKLATNEIIVGESIKPFFDDLYATEDKYIIYKIYNYVVMQNFSWEHKLEYLKHVLRVFSPDWSSDGFEVDLNKQSLKLNAKKLNLTGYRFVSPFLPYREIIKRSFFSNFLIKKIKLINFQNFDQIFYEIQVGILDLSSNEKVIPKDFLKNLKYIRKLILNQDQLIYLKKQENPNQIKLVLLK